MDKPSQTEIDSVKRLYEVGTPFQKGYISYVYGEIYKGHIPQDNPYKKGTRGYLNWIRGGNMAAIHAQESEDD